jgi:hypothetical protein
MKSAAGVFRSSSDALRAVDRLNAIGIPYDRINLLAPYDSLREIERVPTTEAERRGVGTAVGALVGGVTGAALGPIGAAFLSVTLPGIGSVAAAGMYAAALLGAGGAIAGAAAGGALEEATSQGLPRDELYVYEDALRQGRSVVIALADGEEQVEAARQVLAESGAESIDAARKHWWLGIRDVEAAHYDAPGRDFGPDEETYRRGFEAALSRDLRGLSYEAARIELRRRYPDLWETEPFERGYRRGVDYDRRMREQPQEEPELRCR